MKKTLFILFILLGAGAMAQDGEIVDFAEVSPSFPGGDNEMAAFIRGKCNYPDEALKKGLEGTVYVQFVVRTNGQLTDLKIIRGEYQVLNDEALRVVGLMPNWIPAEQNGEKVNCRYTLPIHFRI